MANSMRFVILGDDKASAAFDRFARSVDKANRAVDKSSASMRAQKKSQDSMAKSTLGLAAGLVGLDGVVSKGAGKMSLFRKALLGADLATGLLEPAISGLVVTTLALAGSVVSAGAGLAAYGLAVKPILGTVSKLNQLQAQAAAGSKAAKKQLDLLLKTTPADVVKFAGAVKQAQDAYKKWSFSLATPVLAPLSAALKLVHPVLTAITPLATEAAAALHQLVLEMAAKIQSGGLTNIVNTLLPHVRVGILDLAHSFGNLLAGLWGILRAFIPFSDGVSGGLVKLTARFKDWGLTLSSHTGFKSLISSWKDNWPLLRQGLGSLLLILKNVGSAMAGIATPANSKALWQVANPLLALAVGLSSHPDLVRALLYITLIGKGTGQIKSAMDAVKGGWGGISRFLSLVTGGKVQLGMQTAGDTMLAASQNMQKAADTLAAGSGTAGVAGKAGGAAEAGGTAAVAGGAVARIGKIVLRAGLGALIIPATAMIIGTIIPKNTSAQAAADFKNQPGIVVRVSNFLHVTGMGGWIDQYFSHPIRAWFENSLPHFAETGFNTTKHVIISAWNTIWAATLGPLERFRKQDSAVMGGVRHDIAAAWDGARRDLGTAISKMHAAWSASVSFLSKRAQVFRADWATVTSAVHRAWSTATNAMHDAWNRTTMFFRSAADTAWRVIKAGIRVVWTVISTIFGSIINGAAKAFGWVPGLGGKLKNAAKAFNTFRDNVNAALGGVRSRHVGFKISFTNAPVPIGVLRAHGGPVRGPGGPTGDQIPAMLSDYEYVHTAAAHQHYGTAAMDAVNTRRARIVYRAGGGSAGAQFDVRPSTPSNKTIVDGAAANLVHLARQFVQGLFAGGAAGIVRDAMRWLHKIPYVWGGTAVPGGADCSGFTQTIYGRHGISAPRTSEAQGAWVRRTGPVPGGLAFYHSPAGGADPGHVAIIGYGGQVISQGGGLGPQLMGLHGLPLLWTGVPPHGFPGPGGGGGGGGRRGLGQLEQLWMGAGGPGGNTAHIAGAIALAESGGRANARNASGASGLWQILGQVVPGNIFNPFVNAENAVTKWRDARGFGPWVTYVDGAYKRFLGNGGPITEPIAGVGLRTGASYSLGEAGTEYVSSQADMKSMVAEIRALRAEVRALRGDVASHPERTGRSVAGALNGTSRRVAAG